MADWSSMKLSQQGRRNFMKSMSALGVSAPALPGLSKARLRELTSNPEDEVPRIAVHKHTNHAAVQRGDEPPKREPVYYTIPRAEWLRTEGAVKGGKIISKSLPSDPQLGFGITTLSDGTTSTLIDFEVIHHVDGTTSRPEISFEEVKESVPPTISVQISYGDQRKTVEDIPVTVKKSESVEQLNCEYNSKYRPVPGGCEGGTTTGSGCASTLGTPCVNTSTFEEGWATAAHVVDYDVGDTYYQPSDINSDIGVADKTTSKGEGDAAWINSNGPAATWEIASPDGSYSYDINGTVAKDHTKDMAANQGEATFQGRVSERIFCEVSDWIGSGQSGGLGGDSVVVTADSTGGDSGGLYWETRNGSEAYILGIHSRGVDWDSDGSEDEARGNCMYWIEDLLGIGV